MFAGLKNAKWWGFSLFVAGLLLVQQIVPTEAARSILDIGLSSSFGLFLFFTHRVQLPNQDWEEAKQYKIAPDDQILIEISFLPEESAKSKINK